MFRCFTICSLPQNLGSYITIDNMSVFNTPRKFVRSLEQQSSSKNTCRKLESSGELADSAEANHDNLNAMEYNSVNGKHSNEASMGMYFQI